MAKSSTPKLSTHTPPRAWELAALAVIHEAGLLLRRGFRSKLRIQEKPNDAGLVTQFDEMSEAKLLGGLGPLVEGVHFLAEESGHSRASSRRRLHQNSWNPKGDARFIIDPLDGTTNFAHRFPMYAISVALEVDGQVRWGAIHHPELQETTIALRGKGCRLYDTFSKRSRSISVNLTRKLPEALLSTGFTTNKKRFLTDEIITFQKIADQGRAIRRPGAAALDLAYVARGTFDVFWERNLAAWDIAAGALCVQEAGGRCTEFSGAPLSLQSPTILACSPQLHRSVVNLIA